jgi:hypothetical protein
MPTTIVPRFEAITPRSRFYIELLGFEPGWKWGSPVSHANVCRDSISIDLIAVPSGSRPALAYVRIPDVDAYYAELQKRSVQTGDLADRVYGMRNFEVVDPDGNRVALGESLEV